MDFKNWWADTTFCVWWECNTIWNLAWVADHVKAVVMSMWRIDSELSVIDGLVSQAASWIITVKEAADRIISIPASKQDYN